VPGVARHGFTHFELEMQLFTATVAWLKPAEGEEARPITEAGQVLPSVMNKLLALPWAAAAQRLGQPAG
jgi:A/G-specific adenine glycosylase